MRVRRGGLPTIALTSITLMTITVASSCHGGVPLFDRPSDPGRGCPRSLSVSVSGREGMCAADVPRMAASTQSLCVIDDDTIRCWSLRAATTPLTHPRGLAWRTLASGAAGVEPTPGEPWRLAAIDEEGALYVWGEGPHGELGLGSTEATTVLTRVGLDTWRSVAMGVNATCGVTEEGELHCWGEGIEGLEATSDVPRRIGDRSDWELVAGTNSHFCAVSRAGEIRCSGRYRVGTATAHESFAFEDTIDVPPILSVAVGHRSVCAIDVDAQVWCWGERRLLATGEAGDDEAGPVHVDGIEATQIGIAGSTTCAASFRDAEPGLWCWGSGEVLLVRPEWRGGTQLPAYVAGSQLATCALEVRRIGCDGPRSSIPAGSPVGGWDSVVSF